MDVTRESAVKRTKDILIKYLRAFLNNYDNYNDVSDEDYSNSEIFDKEPNVLRQFPTIIFTGGSGILITSGLGDFSQELYNDNDELVGYQYSGMFEFNFTIELGTKSTLDRERLTDLIIMAYRVYLRRYIEAEGILIKDIRFNGESEILYDSDKIYVANLQISTWSEWYKDIDFLPLKEINIDENIMRRN